MTRQDWKEFYRNARRYPHGLAITKRGKHYGVGPFGVKVVCRRLSIVHLVDTAKFADSYTTRRKLLLSARTLRERGVSYGGSLWPPV